MTPDLDITYEGSKLVANKDYNAVYSANKNIGTAKVQINGIGGYTGSATVSFQIKVKKMNPKNTLCTKFKYTSKKSKIAKVSSKGKITAVKKGSATITVTCGNNKKAKATPSK